MRVVEKGNQDKFYKFKMFEEAKKLSRIELAMEIIKMSKEYKLPAGQLSNKQYEKVMQGREWAKFSAFVVIFDLGDFRGKKSVHHIVRAKKDASKVFDFNNVVALKNNDHENVENGFKFVRRENNGNVKVF